MDKEDFRNQERKKDFSGQLFPIRELRIANPDSDFPSNAKSQSCSSSKRDV